MYPNYRFALKLKRPLNLKRRLLHSSDPYLYKGELVQGRFGFGEVIDSRKLAQEIADFDPSGFNVRHDKIPIAGMIDFTGQKAVAEALNLTEQGFQTLKLKVGRSPELELETLREISQQIDSKIAIRLDANRQFSLSEAIDFAKQLGFLNIDYFEEPCQNPKDIPAFYAATSMPVALDESLVEWAGGVPELAGVKTYALKPFLMPDLASVFECIDTAQRRGIEVAICSAFESGYSLSWLALLASSCNQNPVAAGLSTYRWFEEDLIDPPFKAEDGWVNLLLHQKCFDKRLDFSV
ncbi:MAG: enolase C-terminal domain-like protein [Myxococcota bacterium]